MSTVDPYNAGIDDIGHPKYPANVGNPANVNYHYHVAPNCKCGCTELLNRINTLETAVLQLKDLVDKKQDKTQVIGRKFI